MAVAFVNNFNKKFRKAQAPKGADLSSEYFKLAKSCDDGRVWRNICNKITIDRDLMIHFLLSFMSWRSHCIVNLAVCLSPEILALYLVF